MSPVEEYGIAATTATSTNSSYKKLTKSIRRLLNVCYTKDIFAISITKSSPKHYCILENDLYYL